jgi:hypothetical protein
MRPLDASFGPFGALVLVSHLLVDALIIGIIVPTDTLFRKKRRGWQCFH